MKWIWHNPERIPHLDYFINPLPAAAMIVMALNDHWLKMAYPGWLTGKISDFMGMFYFPLFLCAVYCLTVNLVRRWAQPIVYINRLLMLAAMTLSAILMMSVKLSPVICRGIETWFSRFFFAIRLVADPSDLLALLVLPLSYWYASRFFNERPALLKG